MMSNILFTLYIDIFVILTASTEIRSYHHVTANQIVLHHKVNTVLCTYRYLAS